MSKALSIPADRKARLLVKLLDRLETGLDSGATREAIDIAKALLPHLLPAPAKVQQQVLVASAHDGGRLEAIGKVQARIGRADPDTLDATFTPLPRVQTDE